MVSYNENFVLKIEGYFYSYIYKYSDFISNIKVLNPVMIRDNWGIVYLTHKTKLVKEIHLTNILYFNDRDYKDWIHLLGEVILYSNILKFGYTKQLNNLLIVFKIWTFRKITEDRIKQSALEKFNRKLIRFQTIVNKLIDYKVTTSANYRKLYSRFLVERILTKELKPVLHIKVEEPEHQDECLLHLLNLMSKKWDNINRDSFKRWFINAIQTHQDNWEHNDAWEININNKKKRNEHI